MMRSTGLFVAGVVCIGALVAATACGSSAEDSGFGSSGTSGTSGTSGENTSSGANGSGGFGGSGGLGDGGPEGGALDECKKMDIVFVVDNSGSMREEQTNLATNFPKFVKVIDEYKTKSGDILDYRVAVTSSDNTKDKGKFFATRGSAAPSGCAAGPAKPWLERTDGDVAGFFSCRAEIGVTGSGTERPLESMLLGVTDRIADGTNTASGASFVREDALLAFVIITDEDEGSSTTSTNNLARPMAEYPPGFDKVKGERARWAASVIAGPNACSSPGLGSAAEARRLKGFITEVGKNGVFSSICTGDLTDGLSQALAKFDQACKDFPSGPVK